MEERLNRAMWDGRRKRGQRGFTLIELLVVIAVLGVLAAIVIFNVLGSRTRAAMQRAPRTRRACRPPWMPPRTTASRSPQAPSRETTEGPAVVPQYMHTFPTSCSGGFNLVSITGGGFNVVGSGTGTTYTG